MTDPVSDMLTRIRNANTAMHDEVIMPSSKLKVALAGMLESEGYIGIEFDVPEQTKISISGIDKQVVGQVAAEIRAFKKPEPYKGKGIRYAGEHVIRKAGKQAKTLASASSLEADLRSGATGNATAAAQVGTLIAERAKAAGVSAVVFDRGGNRYHGRIAALADAAREAGLEF
ncbi:UNVERIFIED_CONTAM: hypothetical protein GTU68_003784 [Idotea baltica]|nr:hypothetical protein [Idotea baltica]